MSSLDALLRPVRGTLLTIAAVAIAVLVALGVRSCLASRDAASQLAATVAAQKQLLDQAATREQQRDAALAKTLAGISKAKRVVQTPAQAVAQIPSVLPPLPQPISLSLTESTPPESRPLTSTPSALKSNESAPPAIASVPQADLKPLYDFLQDCRACQAQSAVAQADLADERSKVTALTTERDAAIKAARGGGFWSRLRRSAKWFLIGGAVGALAAEAAHR